MRTTLTIETDVESQLKQAVAMTGLTYKDVINQALRFGLKEVTSPMAAKPYRTEGRAMGLKPGLSYDNVEELLDHAEGEKRR